MENANKKKRSEQGGKTRLVEAARKKGLSKRKAEKIVNVLFDSISEAVHRGEVVELPLGKLWVAVVKGEDRKRLQRFRNVNTGEIQSSTMVYPGTRRVVRFRPKVELEFPSLPPPPPNPRTVAAIADAARCLRGGLPPSRWLMDALLELVRAKKIKATALRRRLEMLIQEQRVKTEQEINAVVLEPL